MTIAEHLDRIEVALRASVQFIDITRTRRALEDLSTLRRAIEEQAAEVSKLKNDCSYWRGKFEQEKRLRDAPKLTSTVMSPDSGSIEAEARDRLAVIGFSATERELSTLKDSHKKLAAEYLHADSARLEAIRERDELLASRQAWYSERAELIAGAFRKEEELRAELAALREDKERMDWVESELDDLTIIRDRRKTSVQLAFCSPESGCPVEVEEETARAAIDAARKAEGMEPR